LVTYDYEQRRVVVERGSSTRGEGKLKEGRFKYLSVLRRDKEAETRGVVGAVVEETC
jgi:hypothetical protein